MIGHKYLIISSTIDDCTSCFYVLFWFFNHLPMPPRLDHNQTYYVDIFCLRKLKNGCLIFNSNSTLIFDVVIRFRQLFTCICTNYIFNELIITYLMEDCLHLYVPFWSFTSCLLGSLLLMIQIIILIETTILYNLIHCTTYIVWGN